MDSFRNACGKEYVSQSILSMDNITLFVITGMREFGNQNQDQQPSGDQKTRVLGELLIWLSIHKPSFVLVLICYAYRLSHLVFSSQTATTVADRLTRQTDIHDPCLSPEMWGKGAR